MNDMPQLPSPRPGPNHDNVTDPNNWRGPEGEAFFNNGLIGARWFKVVHGTITGVFHAQEYVDGNNIAVCNTNQLGMPVMLNANTFAQSKVADASHKVAGQGCRCGFYAYFKEQNTFLPLPTMDKEVDVEALMGIIEGWGTVTLGPLGFRCSRCRVIALVGPPRIVEQKYRMAATFPTLADAVREFPLTEV
jgi:hypothetical protein